MNNSQLKIENISLEIESPIDTKPMLRSQATELAQIVEAFSTISQSNAWKVLEDKVFNGVLESLRRRIGNEKDEKELFRLQGQIVWAEKYCNFAKLAEVYRTKLENITKQLNAQN